MNRKLWMLALAGWLIVYGLLAVTNVRFELQNAMLGFLAIAAGILLLLDK